MIGPLLGEEENRKMDSVYMAGRWQFNLLRFQIPFVFQEHIIGLPISFLYASHDQLIWPTYKQESKP